MNRSLLARMIALLAVVVLGTYYIVFDVLGYRLGAQDYTLTALAPSAGGIYSGADVTYRGVPVGVVSKLDLRTDGVDIVMSIHPGTRIPANVDANVRELSALGEQYLDLEPPVADTAVLRPGAVIPASRVTVPVPIGTALIDLGSLVSSINPGDLRTVEQFLYTAFDGTGPSLTSIVNTGQELFNSLVAAQAETQNLIVDGKPVLQTFQATDSQFATFAAGLNQVTSQLDASNQDLKQLIANGQSVEATGNPFLGSNDANIESLIASLGTASSVAQAYQPSIQQFFQVLPSVAAHLGATASGGQVHGELTFNTANTVCPYLPATEIPLPTQAVASPTLTNGCSTSAPDLLQRGAQIAPGG